MKIVSYFERNAVDLLFPLCSDLLNHVLYNFIVIDYTYIDRYTYTL